MRGTPYIFQGEEIGMTNPHYTSVSQYRDIESINYYEILLAQGKSKAETLEILAARSRDNGRTPMQWDDTAYAGFSETEPWIEIPDNYKMINTAAQQYEERSIFAYYKQLIRLRKDNPLVADGDIAFMEEDNPHILAYQRSLGGERWFVWNNLTGDQETVRLPRGCEHHRIILGNYESADINQEKCEITLRPYEALVLSE